MTRVIRHNYLVDDRVIAQLGSEDVINTFRDYGIDIQYIAQSTLARASVIGYSWYAILQAIKASKAHGLRIPTNRERVG
ncbi:hypothetical protein [Vulcanisaeta sp. JCM 16159]|uniref:hypothetical protein n=1 Tax=Vulcanisaeta sp. JCM 16159 TaxID=1295371 RepID=UPI001FB243E5|nr:hypothetical protein [Vulcanisaeta sp. JCM 16159]